MNKCTLTGVYHQVNQETHELLAQVASMYYERDMTQNEIADELGLSRVKVYRLLRDARSSNVVKISIDWPIKREEPLESTLCKVFGLQDARVLRTTSDHTMPRLRQLGYLGARYLESMLATTSTMSICLGRSTYEVISAIRPDFQANVKVVQAIGSLPYPREEYDSSILVRELAQKLGGQVMYLTSPLLADSPHAASIIRSQKHVQRTLVAASSADIALLGIGNLDPQSSGFVREGFVSAEELTAMIDGGAIGDVAWRIYMKDGAEYRCEFNDRVIGISLDELRNIRTTVAVAIGLNKVQAIVGALRSSVINVLCTDDQTASAILRIV